MKPNPKISGPAGLEFEVSAAVEPPNSVLCEEALISAVLGTKLPGPGTIYLSQTLKFRAPVRPGDTVQTTVTVRELIADKNRVVLDAVCAVGELVVLQGEAVVLAPVRA